MFHHQMKHLEVCQKYLTARHIFNSLLGVSAGDETLHLMLDVLHAKCVLVSTTIHLACFKVLFPCYKLPWIYM